MPSRPERERALLVLAEKRDVEVDVLGEAKAPLAAVRRGEEAEPAGRGGPIEGLLRVTRREAALGRDDPDLQEVDGLVLRVIELAVRDACLLYTSPSPRD